VCHRLGIAVKTRGKWGYKTGGEEKVRLRERKNLGWKIRVIGPEVHRGKHYNLPPPPRVYDPPRIVVLLYDDDGPPIYICVCLYNIHCIYIYTASPPPDSNDLPRIL